LTLDVKSTILYAAHGSNLAARLHKLMVGNKLGKALSFFENLRMVIIKGPALETAPGMIQRVTQPLARNNINVFGLVTISSSIRIFVSKDNADAAVDMLRSALLALG
jgi:aspartate kinase